VTTHKVAQPTVTKSAPMLNSERIKAKFGSYGIKVLESKTPNVRLSDLYSTHGTIQTCRTFAITVFEQSMNDQLKEAHKLIVEKGQSIGSTFKDLGWTVTKENLNIGTTEPTEQITKLMNLDKSAPLAVHVYRLLVSKGEFNKLPYAIITEIHHPDYLSVSDLHRIYESAADSK
jgi:hypothetical protein